MKNITKTALLLLLVAAGTMGATAQTVLKPMACESLTLTGTVATGPGTLSYQWYAVSTVSGAYTPIPGCATQNCTIAAADAVGTVEYKRVVTSSSCPSSPSAEATITVHYQGVKGGTVCWAPVNVGIVNKWVQKPDDYGSFFQWNRNLAWHPTTPTTAPSGWVSTNISDASWTVNPCPAGWRLPTQAEFNSLACFWATANSTKGNAVAGCFTSSNCTLATDAGMANCIFLPAAGRRNAANGTLSNQNTMGTYWTSTQYTTTTTYGYYAGMSSGSGKQMNYDLKSNGFSVRCVKTI